MEAQTIKLYLFTEQLYKRSHLRNKYGGNLIIRRGRIVCNQLGNHNNMVSPACLQLNYLYCRLIGNGCVRV